MYTYIQPKMYFFLIVLCITGPAFAGNTACKKTSSAEALAKNNNLFAIDLYQQIRTAEGNIFFSPYSIRTALAMTYAGARAETAAQMNTALNFTMDVSELHRAFAQSISTLNAGGNDNYEMNVANSLWGDTTCTFLQPFIDTARDSYGGRLKQVDFINASDSARRKINTWVEEQTRDRIRDLIPPGGINADTRLALVNAVYFKGLWSEQFDSKLTRNESFYHADGTTAETPLMTFSKPLSLPFFAGDGIKLLELDYRGDGISMLILLPDTAGGLAAVEARLSEALLDRWAGNLKKQMVSVHLPRFSMTWGAENMSPHLRALGMQDAFIKGAADFSGIDGTRELMISSVFHKAFVDVNEEGTEAAAATGVMVGVTSMPPPPEVFRADHPFLFIIREKATGSILFVGRLTEPDKN